MLGDDAVLNTGKLAMSKGMVFIDDASLDILHNGIVVYSVPMTWVRRQEAQRDEDGVCDI
jgi:hypothetical protein